MSSRSDSLASIWRASGHFFSGTLLSRITGMLRDVSTAYAFGSHPSVAAFFMAFRFAHLFRRLLGEGAMQSAVVPVFESLRNESPQSAGRFFRDLLLSLSLVILGLVAIGELGLGCTLLWAPLNPDTFEVLSLTALMLPSLLFICLFGVNMALLQCEKRYFLSGFAPAMFNVIWIIAVLSLAQTEEVQAMRYLGFAVIIACLANWLITVPTVRYLVRQLGLKSIWRDARLFSPAVRRLWKPLTLGIVGVSAAQLNSAVDVLFARYADPSGPAYLWYAIRVQQLPLALFGIALSGALLPPLSRAARENDHSRFQSFLGFALERSYALIFPCMVFIFVAGGSVIGLLFGRGDFGAVANRETVLCLWAYSLGLVPAVWVLLLAPAFYARQNYSTPTKCALATVGLNFCTNSVLIIACGAGPWSVAVATSLSSFANCYLLRRALIRENLYVAARLWHGTVYTLMAAGVTAGLSSALFPAQSVQGLYLGLDPERAFLWQLLGCGVLWSSFFGVYALLWKARSGSLASRKPLS